MKGKKTMRITVETNPQEVAAKTNVVINKDAIPNMILKNEGNPNGFTSDKKDYEFWLHLVCDRHKKA